MKKVLTQDELDAKKYRAGCYLDSVHPNIKWDFSDERLQEPYISDSNNILVRGGFFKDGEEFAAVTPVDASLDEKMFRSLIEDLGMGYEANYQKKINGLTSFRFEKVGASLWKKP